MKKTSIVFALLVFATSTFCQEIHESDKMWSKKIVRAIDLRELQNQSFYARGNELPKLLIDALKEGKLTPYINDSLNKDRIFEKEEYMSAMAIPSDFIEQDTAFMDSLDLVEHTNSRLQSLSNYYFARDLYQIELTEELVFDKQHSVLERNILALTLFVPADHPDNVKGIQMPVASFDYKECEKLFTHDLVSTVRFNPNNDSAHLNLADAFEFRLFSSYLVKVSNPDDEYLVDKYGGDQAMGITGSQIEEMVLMENEHNLWEN